MLSLASGEEEGEGGFTLVIWDMLGTKFLLRQNDRVVPELPENISS